jgi:hypothetical protein
MQRLPPLHRPGNGEKLYPSFASVSADAGSAARSMNADNPPEDAPAPSVSAAPSVNADNPPEDAPAPSASAAAGRDPFATLGRTETDSAVEAINDSAGVPTDGIAGFERTASLTASLARVRRKSAAESFAEGWSAEEMRFLQAVHSQVAHTPTVAKLEASKMGEMLRDKLHIHTLKQLNEALADPDLRDDVRQLVRGRLWVALRDGLTARHRDFGPREEAIAAIVEEMRRPMAFLQNSVNFLCFLSAWNIVKEQGDKRMDMKSGMLFLIGFATLLTFFTLEVSKYVLRGYRTKLREVITNSHFAHRGENELEADAMQKIIMVIIQGLLNACFFAWDDVFAKVMLLMRDASEERAPGTPTPAPSAKVFLFASERHGFDDGELNLLWLYFAMVLLASSLLLRVAHSHEARLKARCKPDDDASQMNESEQEAQAEYEAMVFMSGFMGVGAAWFSAHAFNSCVDATFFAWWHGGARDATWRWGFATAMLVFAALLRAPFAQRMCRSGMHRIHVSLHHITHAAVPPSSDRLLSHTYAARALSSDIAGGFRRITSEVHNVVLAASVWATAEAVYYALAATLATNGARDVFGGDMSGHLSVAALLTFLAPWAIWQIEQRIEAHTRALVKLRSEAAADGITNMRDLASDLATSIVVQETRFAEIISTALALLYARWINVCVKLVFIKFNPKSKDAVSFLLNFAYCALCCFSAVMIGQSSTQTYKQKATPGRSTQHAPGQMVGYSDIIAGAIGNESPATEKAGNRAE